LVEAKAFPRRLSFPKLCDILVAYLNAGADKGFVGVSDVVEKSNVTLHNISRNNNFLKSWGFIVESEAEPGKYKLTQKAAEFAYAYRIDPNGERTREMLESVLSNDEVLLRFVERVRNESLGREALLVELPRVTGDLRADKVGLMAFLDMLGYAFQLEGMTEPAILARPTRGARKVTKPLARALEALPKPSAATTGARISINLAISPEITPERLKEYIKAVLDAYNEYDQKKQARD